MIRFFGAAGHGAEDGLETEGKAGEVGAWVQQRKEDEATGP